VLAAAVVSVALPAGTSAQTPATFHELIPRVTLGESVFVTVPGGGEVKGPILALTTDTLTILREGGDATFTPREVSRVRKEISDSLWSGAVIGAGVALAAPLWYCSHAYESGETCAEGTRALLIIGGIGAGIGSALDARTKRRIVVYPGPLEPRRDTPSGEIAVSRVFVGGGLPGAARAEWAAAASGRLGEKWAIAGEFGSSSKESTTARTLVTSANTVYTFVIGPRWIARERQRTRIFVQTLAGEVRLSSRLKSCGIFAGTACEGSVGEISDSSRLALQTGGGFDFRLNGTLAARVQADHRLLVGRGGGHEVRFASGAVFRF
jgi:hypothetical protein